MICNSKYLENLNISLNNVTRLNDIINQIQLEEFFINCKIVLGLLSDTKAKALLNDIINYNYIESIQISSKELELNNDNFNNENIIQMLKKIRQNNCVHYEVKKWPQFYINLSVYPVIADINSKKVILSPNIMKGSYDNVKHYIDVQFRLLREDFIAPMREGIHCYKTLNKCNKDIHKMPNMHIYFRAKIAKKKKINKHKENLYVVYFYTKEDCSIESKKFMFESLLVFSNDNFHSMFFAKVIKMNRKISDLSKNMVIELLGNNLTINLNSLYTMAESDVYYLPYLYTMNVLKTFNDYNFPMKSYIVYGKTKPKIPAYLKNNSKIYNINGLRFDILNSECWPDNEFLGLDTAQSVAFKAALTEEFTVIQGPPGTGKTYIGLRIVRSIIENIYEINDL